MLFLAAQAVCTILKFLKLCELMYLIKSISIEALIAVTDLGSIQQLNHITLLHKAASCSR